MNEFINIYCERLGPGFWAEPVNAVTNAAFFIAALALLGLLRQRGRYDWQALILIAFIAIIGTGSFLFHTFATMWAQLSDSIPILFYQIAFLVFFARGGLGYNRTQAALFLGAFLLTTMAVYQLPHHWLNGSIGYAPALLFLTLTTILHYVKLSGGKDTNSEASGRLKGERKMSITALSDMLKTHESLTCLAAANVLFILSLTFRSIDMQLCAAFPLGTHFMWHILNGAVLYCTTRGYISTK